MNRKKKVRGHMNRYQVLQHICRKPLKIQHALKYMHEWCESIGLNGKTEAQLLQITLDNQDRFKEWITERLYTRKE